MPVSRSQEHIRGLFRKYDVIRCQFTDDLETGDFALRFVRRVKGIPRSVRVTISTEGNAQQSYRALYWWLKSQFEAIDFGLFMFEDVFLSHFEWMLEDGTVATMGELVKPRLGAPGGGTFLLPEGRR